MARFLVATMPVPGHVAPIAPVVRRLVEREQAVVWYTAKFFRNDVEAAGAEFCPIRLDDPRYRTQAAAISCRLAESYGPAMAVGLLEKLAETHRPVLRTTGSAATPEATGSA